MVEGTGALFNLENKVDKLQLAFIVGSGAFGLMCFAALPLFSAWAIMTLSVTLGFSLDKWLDSEQIPAPEMIVPDQTIKIALATSIICLGVYFSFFNVFPQILIGGIGSVGLSAFFITQCVINPQQKLNRALREAVTSHNLENVTTLLDRGADPFELDAQNNHCFHHAISNNENSAAILEALYQHSRLEKMDFRTVMSQFRRFQDPTLLNHFRAWYNALKPLFNNRIQGNRDNFYAATETLLNALGTPFQAILNNAFKYVQQQIEHEKTINSSNRAGNTPEEMIDVVFTDSNNVVRNALKRCFTGETATANTLSTAAAPIIHQQTLPTPAAATLEIIIEPAATTLSEQEDTTRQSVTP